MFIKVGFLTELFVTDSTLKLFNLEMRDVNVFLEIAALAKGELAAFIWTVIWTFAGMYPQVVEEFVLVTHGEAAGLASLLIMVAALKDTVFLLHLTILLKAIILVIEAVWSFFDGELVEFAELLASVDFDEVVGLDLGVAGNEVLWEDILNLLELQVGGSNRKGV